MACQSKPVWECANLRQTAVTPAGMGDDLRIYDGREAQRYFRLRVRLALMKECIVK
jgi:hypothetical protein